MKVGKIIIRLGHSFALFRNSAHRLTGSHEQVNVLRWRVWNWLYAYAVKTIVTYVNFDLTSLPNSLLQISSLSPHRFYNIIRKCLWVIILYTRRPRNHWNDLYSATCLRSRFDTFGLFRWDWTSNVGGSLESWKA
jgi:hypothetical protein